MSGRLYLISTLALLVAFAIFGERAFAAKAKADTAEAALLTAKAPHAAANSAVVELKVCEIAVQNLRAAQAADFERYVAHLRGEVEGRLKP